MLKLFSTLRSRLLMTYLGLIVLGFGGLTLFSGQQIAQSAFDDFASGLRVQAFLVASDLVDPLEDGMPSQTIGENLLRHVTEEIQEMSPDAQVAIVDQEGRLWMDSMGSTEFTALDTPPEIISAKSERVVYDIRPDSNGVSMLYTSAPIDYEGATIGYAQVYAPVAPIWARVQQRWIALGGVFVLFTLIGTVLCLWLITTLTRPLSQLQTTAMRMADGDLSQRVQDPKEDEIGAVGDAFNHMAEQVEAMVHEQRAFASNASHELRTPMTTIRLRTEWLQSGLLDEETSQQYIEEIDHEVKRMGGLVDDLILLSRLDANRLEIGESQVDPGRLTEAVIRELIGPATAKSINLTLDLPEEELPPVNVNMNHLRVVMRNLIENAIKYTPDSGQVQVRIQQEQAKLRLEVVDNGRGIAPDDLPNLTKRFYRADKARSRQQEGIGLGLALVDSIIRLYQGQLEIDSEGLNRGTSVTVWWPIATEAAGV
ncbi:MAG: ATP-binding protein [Chloroflexota bacterium]